MGKKASRAARIEARRRLGPLAKRTVKETTRKLYDFAMALFKCWLRSEGLCWPFEDTELTERLMEYAQVLWEEGESKADLANLLSAFHDAEPAVDPFLRGAWRLYHIWKRDELQEQSTHAKREWAEAMAGLALQWGWTKAALLIMLSFWLLLRTAEAGNLRFLDVVSTKKDVSLLKLGMTKGGYRKGRPEAVVLDKPELTRWLEAERSEEAPRARLLPGGAQELRKKFNVLAKSLGLGNANLRFYSLRRGGATYLFNESGSFDVCAEAGRWSNVRIARVYIDSALQTKYEGLVSATAESRIATAAQFYRNFLQEA